MKFLPAERRNGHKAPPLLAALVSGAALIAALCDLPVARAGAAVEAEFRGCESARVCRFRAASLELNGEALLRVRPDGEFSDADDEATVVAVRNRLNALMSNMIHQHKHIELRDLRSLGADVFAATIVVNGMDLRADPVLLELGERGANRAR